MTPFCFAPLGGGTDEGWSDCCCSVGWFTLSSVATSGGRSGDSGVGSVGGLGDS